MGGATARTGLRYLRGGGAGGQQWGLEHHGRCRRAHRLAVPEGGWGDKGEDGKQRLKGREVHGMALGVPCAGNNGGGSRMGTALGSVASHETCMRLA